MLHSLQIPNWHSCQLLLTTRAKILLIYSWLRSLINFNWIFIKCFTCLKLSLKSAWTEQQHCLFFSIPNQHLRWLFASLQICNDNQLQQTNNCATIGRENKSFIKTLRIYLLKYMLHDIILFLFHIDLLYNQIEATTLLISIHHIYLSGWVVSVTMILR